MAPKSESTQAVNLDLTGVTDYDRDAPDVRVVPVERILR